MSSPSLRLSPATLQRKPICINIHYMKSRNAIHRFTQEGGRAASGAKSSNWPRDGQTQRWRHVLSTCSAAAFSETRAGCVEVEREEMAALRSLSFCLLAVGLLLPAASTEQRITAEAGQDSVTLPCGAGKEKEITALEWSRADLDPDGVLLFMDGRFESDGQHPSFRNRVDLQDRQMKDGDASLILKNVKINDTGTYECRVIQGGNRMRRTVLMTYPISTIHLEVSTPPPPGTQEGGGKGRGDKEGGSLGLTVGLLVSVLCVLVVVLVVIYKMKRSWLKWYSRQPPAKTSKTSRTKTRAS
ncbi:uncharacterized protein ACNS7B_021235 isoform 2-T2 [Menidia menidia]